MPEGQLPSAPNRSDRGRFGGAWYAIFSRCLLGISPVPMHSPDAEKTSFITPHGLYCYNVMPFSLKNVGATYQRLVTKMFRQLLESIMEVYIDDMLVKSK